MERVINNGNRQDEIVDTIFAYQANIEQLLRASNQATKEALQHEGRNSLEHLWELLEDDLIMVARSWVRSAVFESASYSQRDALQSVAMNMFLHIIVALPSLQVDPTRNVQALLATIAHRGLAQEYRKIHQARRSSHSSVLSPETIYRTAVSHVPELEDIVDPQESFEEQIMRRHHAQTTIAAIRDVWKNTLTQTDAYIVKHRVENDPPLPFETIAQQLGPGWNAATVRQRWSRLIKRTRDKLTQMGIEP